MNLYPSFTNLRSLTAYEFSSLRMRALRDAFWSKITGRDTKLAAFPKHEHRKHPNRRMIGTKEVSVEKIIGSFNRVSEFDYQFRPLSKHISDRWVNTYMRLERDGWSPILVHKIGDEYYVEDGHHRVSVARAVGMVFIEANVWEYSAPILPAKTCPPIRCPEWDAPKAYGSLERQSVE
ncbi:MAG TPA: hypothetical protein VJ821_00340 [Anaerolineales bacterium]|nr:hypothetical protein [Anaerolineales bacterium]